MDLLRKISLFLSAAAFAVCELFLNLLGGIGMRMNGYEKCGNMLFAAVIMFAAALTFAFFRKTAFNVLSLLFNAGATVCYVCTLGILNGIKNVNVDVLTSRVYPSVILTVLLAVAIFADILSYDRICSRAERKKQKESEKNCSLSDEEKII